MFTKAVSAAAVALATSSLVSAQTFSACNPTEKSCPSDPAFGREVSCSFNTDMCGIMEAATGTSLKHGGEGAVFTINKETEAPTISTSMYIFYGIVEVDIMAAPGQGIVTSAVLQSDVLDEIDWEFVGGDNAQVQTNYFSKGNTSVYDRGRYHSVANPTGQFHRYSIEWTKKRLVWSIDGTPVRTLEAAQTTPGAGGYPQTPMQIKLGTWVGGSSTANKGTVEWAGGLADFSKAPFVGYYKNLRIVDYAGQSSPSNGGIKEYVYGDMSGTSQSIKVVAGDNNPANPSTAPSSRTQTSSSTRAPSATGAPSATEGPSVPGTSSRVAVTTTGNATRASTLSTTASSVTSAVPPVFGSVSGTAPVSGSVTRSPGTASPSTGATTLPVPVSAASHGAVAVGMLLAGAGAVASLLMI